MSSFPSNWSPPTPDDLAWITAQLGRTDATIRAIAARRSDLEPSVIVNAPLLRKPRGVIPFPTLYWLVCPDLIKAVSRLEMNGWITRLEEQIATDPALTEAVGQDHQRYTATRMSLLADDDRRTAEQQSVLNQLQTTGIAGIANPKRLKCLHAHVAHELADQNAIGRLVMREMKR